MYVIVGLGNPGLSYENTRHNMGFLTLDLLAKEHGIDIRTLKWKALIGEGRIGREKVVLVKPQTFMNRSGESVKQVVDFYKLPPENLIVVTDDIDIPFGTVRVKASGSAGTHNGMRNIIQLLQEDGFPRVKVAVGKRPDYMDLAAFVLSRFDKKEVPVIEDEIRLAAQAVEDIVKNGVDFAMNRTNSQKFEIED